MLKHIPKVAAPVLTSPWWEEYRLLGKAMIVEAYSVDIIAISGAATEADYYA